MHSFMLQDWISPMVDPTLTDLSLTQSEADWLNLQNYEDVVFWIDVRSAQPGGADQVQLVLETSPTKDPSLFTKMANPIFLNPGVPQPLIYPIILSQYVATAGIAPLSRWVRWRIQPDATPTSNWGATFRIFCSANPVR